MVFENEFEQVEKEIMNDIFTIAHEGKQRDFLKQQWQDFKDAMEGKYSEAVIFFKHMQDHPEVKNSPISPGIPMCKICNKDSKQILAEAIQRGE